MAKKPWRPIQISDDEVVGRFTRRQIQDAVRVVKERNEARNKKNGRHPGTAKPGGADGTREASAPKPRRVAAVDARPKREG
jgi:hypothetical protein